MGWIPVGDCSKDPVQGVSIWNTSFKESPKQKRKLYYDNFGGRHFGQRTDVHFEAPSTLVLEPAYAIRPHLPVFSNSAFHWNASAARVGILPVAPPHHPPSYIGALGGVGERIL